MGVAYHTDQGAHLEVLDPVLLDPVRNVHDALTQDARRPQVTRHLLDLRGFVQQTLHVGVGRRGGLDQRLHGVFPVVKATLLWVGCGR